MSRLVDVDTLERKLGIEWGKSRITNSDWRVIRDVVKNVETVDAVKVVRCRDCCYWLGTSKEEYALCSIHDNVYAVTPYYGFCFKGKRRE